MLISIKLLSYKHYKNKKNLKTKKISYILFNQINNLKIFMFLLLKCNLKKNLIKLTKIEKQNLL